MKNKNIIFILFATCCVAFQSDNKDTKNYLGIDGPILFYGDKYFYFESEHTLTTNYTQNYLPEGADAKKFEKKLFYVVNKTALSLNDWANKKIKEIENRKKTDLVAQDSIIDLKESNEYIIVTTYSVGEKRDKKVVEWNVLRYKVCFNNGKRLGIITFGYALRAYGDEIYPHFDFWHKHFEEIINAAKAVTIPEIKNTL